MIKSILQRILRFLRSRPPLADGQVQHILIVGSGSEYNVLRAVADMQGRFPAASVTLLAWRGYEQALSSAPQAIPYNGVLSVASLRRTVAQAAYDLKVVLFTGEGQIMLKLLAFLLPAPRMMVFTEGGGMFEWSFDQRLAIWNHIRWRLGSGLSLGQRVQRLAWALVRPVLTFVAFIVLLAWHGALYVKRAWYRAR